MRIEIGPIVQIRPRDTVVLASDGLFDNLRLAEIINLVRKGPLIKVVEQVSKLCHKRMTNPQESHPSKPDDLTFLIFRPNPNTSIKQSSNSKNYSSHKCGNTRNGIKQRTIINKKQNCKL